MTNAKGNPLNFLIFPVVVFGGIFVVSTICLAVSPTFRAQAEQARLQNLQKQIDSALREEANKPVYNVRIVR